MIRKIKDRGRKEGEQLITKFMIKQEEKKMNTPKRKDREEEEVVVDLNQSARKKIRFGQEELAKVKEAGIVMGNLGKFESETGGMKGRNAKWRKGITGRKDSGRKRQEIQDISFPHKNNTQGELNTSETQRMIPDRSFKFNLTEGSPNQRNLIVKDANFPKLRLNDEKMRPTNTFFSMRDRLKPENSEKVASTSNPRV